MARIVGTWWGDDLYSINFQPEYRFVKITKRLGKEYKDELGCTCVDVEVDTYGYRYVGSKCKPYAYDDWFYLPTVKVGHAKGYFRLYYGKPQLRIGSFKWLKPWDGKTPLAVREHFGSD